MTLKGSWELSCLCQFNMYIQATLDCTLCLMQYPYDPGISPSCAKQCIIGKVYLRFNLLTDPINLTREYPGIIFPFQAVQGQLATCDKTDNCITFSRPQP